MKVNSLEEKSDKFASQTQVDKMQDNLDLIDSRFGEVHSAITEDLQELIDCKYLSESRSILAHIQHLNNEALVKPLQRQVQLIDSKVKSDCVQNFDYKKFTLKTSDELQQLHKYCGKLDDLFEQQDRNFNKALLKFVLKEDYTKHQRHVESEISNCVTVRMFTQLQEVTAKADELANINETVRAMHEELETRYFSVERSEVMRREMEQHFEKQFCLTSIF